jgi:predicted nicotinamide N-methyase
MTSIAGMAAALDWVPVGGERIAVWRVADLARHVDRNRLLAGDDPPEPPYWAHLWSGAQVLAEAIPRGRRTVLELGCGLGLPGLTAARWGARVTFVDRVPRALAFVRASAATNGLGPVDLVAADFTGAALRGRFDLVLAAEVLYDPAAFGAIADALARRIAPRGRALLTDAGRTDTRAFYTALDAAGLSYAVTEHAVREERLPVTVRLVDIRPQLA